MSEVSLRQLEYLVAAAEAGSVTAASSRLHLSQSAVSTALSDLEATLQVQLFIRHPRGMSVTRVGQQVLTDARRLLSGVEDLRNSARDASESLSGRLVVGCYSTLSPILLPRVIADFTAQHPTVDLSFVEGSHAYLEEQLRTGLLDLAILYDYDFEKLGHVHDLATTRVLTSPPYVLLPEDHRLAGKARIRLAQVAAEPMILFDLPPGGDYFRSLFETEDLVPAVRFRTTSFEMVRALVARGLGYSILSQRTEIAESYEGRRFATAELGGPHRGLDVSAVTLRRARLTRRAEAFIEQCIESLA
ncbi:MAG: LysR family transcriptional regulator [Nocardioidaceae bacterium]